MSEERAFKGVWIPAEIWLNSELSITEKALFAEIDSLDGDNGCFASNEYFTEFFNVSESTITRGIAKLKSLGFIESKLVGGRTRILTVVKMTTQSSQNDDAGSSICSVSSIKKKIKDNIIDKAPEPAPALVNTRRKFRVEHEHLTDELSSGEVIDNERRERRKKSNYEKCLDELSSRNFSDEVKELLQKHLDWSYNSKDPKRIKDRVSYKPKLNMLEQLAKKGEDIKRVVQQSIDRQWHAFYEYKGDTVKNQHEPLADKVVMNNPEESHKILMERLSDPNVEVY